MLLKGKNAIITGSNQGLGKEIAREFLKQGANVMICARNRKLLEEVEKELSTKLFEGQELYSYPVDISNREDMQHLYIYLLYKFGRIDILVNNAGIQGAKGLIDCVDIEEWIETININLIGTVYLSKLIIPHMKENKSGKIINISGGGAANPRPNFSAYATSKAAVVRFSECIAEELKPYNIDVNCIAPGAMNTRLLEENLSAGVEKVGEKYYQQALKQKETGGSSITNAAEMITFIASEKCNGLTGKLISSVWDDWKEIPDHIIELRNSDVYTLRRIIPSDINPYWLEKK